LQSDLETNQLHASEIITYQQNSDFRNEVVRQFAPLITHLATLPAEEGTYSRPFKIASSVYHNQQCIAQLCMMLTSTISGVWA